MFIIKPRQQPKAKRTVIRTTAKQNGIAEPLTKSRQQSYNR